MLSILQEKNKNRFTYRLEIIRNHLNAKDNSKDLESWRKNAKFNSKQLKEIYYPFHIDLRETIHKIIAENKEFKHYYMLELNSSEIQRLGVEEINKLLEELSKNKIILNDIRADIKKFFIFLDAIAQFEPGISTKFCAHSVLYYNSLKNIGTEKHQIYLERANNLQDIGCFTMTEFGHGSNVKDIQTTATYDHSTKEFILNSPSIESYKWWIGGLGKVANNAIVIAQLIINGQKHGVHCFLTPIRDTRDYQPFPGVILGSTGPKLGNELIDTGFAGFRNYRIPFINMLDRFSSITEEGIFSSSISNPNERFALALGTLLEGRVLLCGLTQTILANALCIASRYAAIRRQFGPSGKEENFILNYPLVFYRIIPALADNFAFKICSFKLIEKWVELQDELTQKNSKNVIEYHAILSALKPLSSWNSHFHIQRLREVMGAHGYSRFSLMGFFRDTNDANLTWEGDNSVLLQQATKFLISNYRKYLKGKRIDFKSLYFLNKNNIEGLNIRIESPKILYDFNVLRDLFEYRIKILLKRSFNKLMLNARDLNSFDNYNNTQVFYFQKATLAYGELYVFEQFVARINQLDENDTKFLLKEMCVLFALNSLEKNLDILREDDYILSDFCYLIKDEIIKICEKLKDQLIPIIDVIAPRDEILGAPLGYSDGKNFDRYINRVFSHKECFERAPWWNIIHKK